MINREEKKIIQGLISKNEKILFYFYKKYSPLIIKYIKKQVKDYYLVEEITQDTFFDFIEKIRDFRGECSLKNYLFKIAKNKVIDYIRKKKIEKILFSALPSTLVDNLKTILIDEELEKKQLQEKIKKTFQKLPNDYQLVLRLKYIEGEKVKSIAQKLSMKFKTVESLIFRARKAFIKVFSTLT